MARGVCAGGGTNVRPTGKLEKVNAQYAHSANRVPPGRERTRNAIAGGISAEAVLFCGYPVKTNRGASSARVVAGGSAIDPGALRLTARRRRLTADPLWPVKSPGTILA